MLSRSGFPLIIFVAALMAPLAQAAKQNAPWTNLVAMAFIRIIATLQVKSPAHRTR